jgi:hypothetical protein
LTNAYAQLGELNEAITCGTGALEIAVAHGDLKLRTLTTRFLQHHYRGDFEQWSNSQLTTSGSCPEPGATSYSEILHPRPSLIVFWLAQSLAPLGRFSEAAKSVADVTQIAQTLPHAIAVGLAYYSIMGLRITKGDWL